METRVYNEIALLRQGAQLSGTDPSGASDSTSVIVAAIMAIIASGSPGVVTLGPGTFLVSGSGAQSNSNGAAIIINDVNNPSAVPITIRGSGKGVTTLKMASGSSYNIIEVVDTQNGNISMPITIRDLTLDGNGVNQAQQAAGDRYQNGYYQANVAGTNILDVEIKGASYHGFQSNACQNSTARVWSHDNYDNGVVLTGNQGLSEYGQNCDYRFTVSNNGKVQGGQLDTTYIGAVLLLHRNCDITVVSTGHTNSHTNVITPVSGGACLANRLQSCTVNLTSYNDYSALAVDQSLDGCTFNITARSTTTGAAIRDVNATSSAPVRGNKFNCDLRLCPTFFNLGAGSSTFDSNVISGTFLDVTTSNPIFTIGANFKNNVVDGWTAGDAQGSNNVTYLVNASANDGSGNNKWVNGRIIGTLQTGLFNANVDQSDFFHNIDGAGVATFFPTVPASGTNNFATFQYDSTIMINTVGGMTAWFLDGKQLALTVGMPIYWKHGRPLTTTWTVSAPTFNLTPVLN